ncbi:unnamed protein product [Ceutorhynchus assimilis]|uniref:Uncharacterized protein n=1 Tax=Ceutorhynchus assimilis TaxID=467358 RepID=A0A9N9MV86_9CUCU|nr:unnamed protein product [Ceutorhynchus assimilis]
MILFPEEILKTQICSCCKKYLSFGPIKVSISEGVICGRCSKNGEETAPSLLNNIIKNVIFPCVNRFDGCSELLKCEDVPQHESVCTGSLHPCPICVNHSNNQLVEYSLLSLIHHYQILHSKYYLTNPLLSISTNSVKESNYLYCSEYKNILAFINVKIIAGQPYVKIVALGNSKNKIVCSLNCHNIIDNVVTQSSSSTPAGEFYFELLSAANSDNVSDKMCLELELSLLITTSSISGEESTGIGSKFKPEDFKYYGEPYDDFMLKCMPDFIPHQNYQDYYRGRNHDLKKIQKKSIAGKIYTIQQNGYHLYDVMCDFCENYFLLTGTYSYVYYYDDLPTEIKICDNCRASWCPHPNLCKSMERKRCFFCQHSSPEEVHINISFYCRYHCGTAIDSNVFDHEKTCPNNRKAALSDSEFAKFYFGNYFIGSSNKYKSAVIRNNNMIVFEQQFLGRHGRIYMVTDSGFCCIIFYKSDKSDLQFSVAHKYPVDKYYTLFKIVDNENQSFREEKDSFKVSLQIEKFFFVVAPREYSE